MNRLLSYIVRIIVWLSKFAKPLSRLGLYQYEEYTEGQPLKILLVGYNGTRHFPGDTQCRTSWWHVATHRSRSTNTPFTTSARQSLCLRCLSSASVSWSAPHSHHHGIGQTHCETNTLDQPHSIHMGSCQK